MAKKKKRIATMTFHFAHNYGAMLQAYALEKAINKMGFECYVLDYRLNYINRWYGIKTKDDLCKEYGIILGTLKYYSRCIKGYYKKNNDTPQKKYFNSFMRKKLTLSNHVFYQPEDLSKTNYDIIVLGSDQIWNSDLTGGLAKEYFGYYFNKKTTIISYAASCGKGSMPQEYKNEYKALLSNINRISVREHALAENIKTVYGMDAESVLDPVFLLEKEDWNVLASQSNKKIDGKYLLIYAFQTSDDIYRVAIRIAKERNLKLISICYEPIGHYKEIEELFDCSPEEFISLIKNADFVCTSSFHGMAFSLIYNKNFYCMGHPLYSARNRELLSRLNLESRLFYKEKEIKRITDCDYSKVNSLLEEEKRISISFLQHAIDS